MSEDYDPKAHHQHPPEGGSRDGAYNVKPRVRDQYKHLLRAYRDYRNLTAYEAWQRSALADYDIEYWVRCGDLKRRGWCEVAVTDEGKEIKRPGPTGVMSRTLRITEAGEEKLRELEGKTK